MVARDGLWGTGLPASALLAILLVAVCVFLFWGGPLWQADREIAHTTRIAVSYGVVPPLVAVVLAAGKRLSWASLLTATGLLWSVKLVTTASLYFGVAPGTASRYDPMHVEAATAAARTRADDDRYRAAEGEFDSGLVLGQIQNKGQGVAAAVAWIDDPPPGVPLPDGRSVAIGLSDQGFDKPVYTATVEDDFEIVSTSSRLHTFHLHRGAAPLLNTPIAGGASREIDALAAGEYEVRCDNHATEQASLLVFDHPYFARSDPAGKFGILYVPAGRRTLRLTAGPGTLASREIDVAPGAEHHRILLELAYEVAN